MQILLDIVSSSRILPLLFITDLLDFTLTTHNEMMISQVLTMISTNLNYQSILKHKANKLLEEMKTNEDHQNIRLLEKHLLLFNYSRSLISSNDVCLIIDRLISSTSYSSISYSSLDTRYILAMIILNSLSSYDKYLKFLLQTWKSVVREINDTDNLKPVVITYAKQWDRILKMNSTMNDINTLVRYLNDQYDLVSNILQSVDQKQFQQWIENLIQNIVSKSLLLFIDLFKFIVENSTGR